MEHNQIGPDNRQKLKTTTLATNIAPSEHFGKTKGPKNNGIIDQDLKIHGP